MSNKRNWSRKILDSHMGLIFDWRSTSLRSKRVYLLALLIFLIMVPCLYLIDVQVPWSKPSSQQAGAVFLLPKDHPTLAHLITRKTPLPHRGPIWADPVMSGMDDHGICRLVTGLDQPDTELKACPESNFHFNDLLIWSTQLHPQWWKSGMNETLYTNVSCEPYVSLCTSDLCSRIVSLGKQDVFSESSDLSGAFSSFVVTVNQWGVPQEVVLTDSSGNSEADKSAMNYIKSLRWAPSSKIKTGNMTVEWSNKEN